MSDRILLSIDLSASPFSDTTYYISDQLYAGSVVYHPFLLQAPNIQIGGIKNGYLKVNLGSLILSNEPKNSLHPFNGANYATLIGSQQLIPFSISINEGATLFSGNLSLVRFNSAQLEFQVYDQAVSLDTINLLKKRLGDGKVFISSIDDNSGAVKVTTSANHNLSNGQSVLFQFMQTRASELEYSDATDNYYVVRDKTATTFEIDDRDGNSVSSSNIDILYNQTQAAVTISQTGTIVGPWEVHSGSTVTIADGVTVTVTDTVTQASGLPEDKPLVFGRVEHLRPNLIISKSSGLIVNPGFDLNNTAETVPIADIYLEVYEDGILINKNLSGDAADFSTAPTSDIITTDAAFNGEISLSGVGADGTSILDFFTNVVAGIIKLAGSAITIDTTKSPDSASLVPGFEIYAESVASSLSSTTDPETTEDITINRDTVFDSPFTISSGDTVTVSSGFSLSIIEQGIDTAIRPAFINALAFQVHEQQTAIEFASKIAEFVNHQFYIKNGVLYLIDRHNLPDSFTRFQDYEIIESGFEIPAPVKAYKANWEVYRPEGAVVIGDPAQGYPQLVSKTRSASVPLLGVGSEIEVPIFHEGEPEVKSYLSNQLSIDKRPVAEIKLSGINQTLIFGDRVKFSRAIDNIEADFLISEIHYDFSNLITTFKGHCNSIGLAQIGVLDT